MRVNESLAIGTPGILGNDADANGGSLTARLITGPKSGTVSLGQDGSFTYTPSTLDTGDLVLMEHVNLAARLPGVTVNSNGSWFNSPEITLDENPATYWTPNPNALETFIEIVLPQDVTVEKLQLLGSRNNDAKITAGIFQLFAGDGTEIYNTGNLDIPLPSGDVTINVPNLAGVRRMRFTATAGQNGSLVLRRRRGSEGYRIDDDRSDAHAGPESRPVGPHVRAYQQHPRGQPAGLGTGGRCPVHHVVCDLRQCWRIHRGQFPARRDGHGHRNEQPRVDT